MVSVMIRVRRVKRGKFNRLYHVLCLFSALVLQACTPQDKSESAVAAVEQSPSRATEQTAVQKTLSPSIMVLGDSLSVPLGVPLDQGWVALLEDKLKAEGFNFNVVNVSTSGDTTFNGLSKLKGALDQHQPKLVIVELGANDGLRGASIDLIKANLTALINTIRQAQAEVLLLGMLLPPNYGERYTEPFKNIYPAVAEELNVALVPFFLDRVATDQRLMQDDGLHPNKTAQPYLLENVWPYLQPML